MVQGSTLNFKKESAAFAKALQAEHEALGALLEIIEKPSLEAMGLEHPAVQNAVAAHDAVRFQRARTEASVGRR